MRMRAIQFGRKEKKTLGLTQEASAEREGIVGRKSDYKAPVISRGCIGIGTRAKRREGKGGGRGRETREARVWRASRLGKRRAWREQRVFGRDQDEKRKVLAGEACWGVWWFLFPFQHHRDDCPWRGRRRGSIDS